MSKFFIERPIFAWVVAIMIMLAGLAALIQLPISQFPNVAPPAIKISGRYTGASAQTIQDSVLQTIEQQMTGLDGFRYMSSDSSANGSFEIILTFEQGVDPNIAQVQVQNKLALATPLLPTEVQATGMEVDKYQANYMLIVAGYCDDGSLSDSDLGDLMTGQIKDEIGRIDGVGSIDVWGSQYAMRIWLKPDKLSAFDLTAKDVVAAIREQNVQVSVGRLAGAPAPEGVRMTATVVAKSQMTTAQEFRNILLKTSTNGSQIRLSDVAEVELGSEIYEIKTRVNGHPGVGLAIRLAAGGNVLDATDKIKETLASLRGYLPEGLKFAYLCENAPVVRASIHAVVHTLFEAVVLVFCVMFLFLQRVRVTLVPTLTIPVVLLGTFGVLFVCGFTLNVTVLFALTLAIGLLVDDAIVVVENVERLMATEGLDAKAATVKTMEQIQGALVGVGATISAVFLPTAFFGGSTGVIYRQFAISIISSMLLSVFIALTFAPALCASMLKPPRKNSKPFFFFRWFNNLFAWGTEKYASGVGYVTRRRKRFLIAFVAILALVAYWYPKLPTAFLPTEDQGNLYVLVELPPNSSQERTQEILDQISQYFSDAEGDNISNILAVNGFSFAGSNQNAGIFFISLKSFEERTQPGQDVFSIVERAQVNCFSKITKAKVTPVIPPSMMELGNVSGLDFYLLDRAGLGHDRLLEIQQQFLKELNSSNEIAAAWTNSLPDEPQYKVDIDDERVRALNLSLTDVNDTTSIAWGSSYVNDFIDRGRVKRVYVQGESSARASASDFEKWYVRNQVGRMTPFSAFASGHWTSGAPKLARYNGLPGIEFNAVPAAGVSSGVAMARVAESVKKLPAGVDLSYTGLSYEEIQGGSQASTLFALSLLIVFLCLAALYESWSVPFAIAMGVPFGVLGAVVGVAAQGLTNDVFFQVGLLTVMGLSAKNAILIVEFAKQMVEKEGVPVIEAAVNACRLRLRPILMTSAAFALGVLPMTMATGASSLSQQSLGVCVFCGTVVATTFAIFFIPLFYVFVMNLFSRKRKTAKG